MVFSESHELAVSGQHMHGPSHCNNGRSRKRHGFQGCIDIMYITTIGNHGNVTLAQHVGR